MILLVDSEGAHQNAQICRLMLAFTVNVCPKTFSQGMAHLSAVINHVYSHIFRENNQKCHLFKLLLLSGASQSKSSMSIMKGHFCKELCDWMNCFYSNPRSLKDICRVRIRKSLGDLILHRVQYLPLPNGLKDFITMKHL